MSWLLRLRQRWYFFKVAHRCRRYGHQLHWRASAQQHQCGRCGRWSP